MLYVNDAVLVGSTRSVIGWFNLKYACFFLNLPWKYIHDILCSHWVTYDHHESSKNILSNSQILISFAKPENESLMI